MPNLLNVSSNKQTNSLIHEAQFIVYQNLQEIHMPPIKKELFKFKFYKCAYRKKLPE